MNNPKDWCTPATFDNGEHGYWLTREGVIFFAMKADGKVATQAQAEIANIVAAWYRGEIFPRSAAPTVAMILEFDKGAEADTKDSSYPKAATQPHPIEVLGSVAGMQKHLVKLAEQNRRLDHAALKELFDEHQVVIAVWKSESDLGPAPGPGFLTLKGADYLLGQIKQHRTNKIRATMTAIWCKNREHAELLQQAFV
jgi:hypothetical protein